MIRIPKILLFQCTIEYDYRFNVSIGLNDSLLNNQENIKKI